MSYQRVEIELRLQRERDGRCGTCGIDTHETIIVGEQCVKRGLTIEGEVRRGRCLFCNPLTNASNFKRVSTPSEVSLRQKEGTKLCEPPIAASSAYIGHDESDVSSSSNFGQIPTRTRKRGAVASLVITTTDDTEDMQRIKKHASASNRNVSMGGTPKRLPESDEVSRKKSLSPNLSIQNSHGKKRTRDKVTSMGEQIETQDSFEPFVNETLASCKAKPENWRMQDKCMESLRIKVEKEKNDLRKRDIINAMYRCGCLDVALDAMKRHATKSSVQYEGCKMIASLAWSGLEEEVGAKGGITLVLAAINSLSTVKSAGAGIEALVNLSTSPQIRNTIVAESGLHAVVSAMKNYPRNVLVQENGCKFVLNIFSDGKERDAVKITKAGVIPAIVDAMKTHHDNDVIMEAGCEALQNLSVTKETRTEIAKDEGLGFVLSLIESEAEEVQGDILGLLQNLTTDHHELQERVAIAHGVALLLGLMEEFPRNAALQEKICAVLQNVTSCEKGRDLFIESKGIQAVVKSIKQNEEFEKVHDVACSLLWNAAKAPRAKNILKGKDVIDALKYSASKFPESCGDIVGRIQSAISNKRMA